MTKWHVISVTWSKEKNISNCWSNGEKLITFTTGNIKDSDDCYIGDLGKIPGWSKTHLTGCISEIIGFHKISTDEENFVHSSIFHEKVGLVFRKCEVPDEAIPFMLGK